MITPLNETSLIDMPNGTVLEVQVYKKHAGKVQLIGVAPNGDYKVIMDFDLLAQPLIDRNIVGNTINTLPNGWPTDHHLKNPPAPFVVKKVIRKVS